MILVFDTETTGFPTYKNAFPFYTNMFDNARMIEIAYVLIDHTNHHVVKEVSYLIKDDSRESIPNSHVHGITNEMTQEHGVRISEFFNEFYEDLKLVDTIVAHNIDFDMRILLSELYRYYPKQRNLIGLLYCKRLECTMHIGMRVMNVVKYPKLTDLYTFLFNESWEQNHRALDDVMVCMKCYLKMLRTD